MKYVFGKEMEVKGKGVQLDYSKKLQILCMLFI